MIRVEPCFRFHCTCRLCGRDWYDMTVPKHCRYCRALTWNGDHRQKKWHKETGSRIEAGTKAPPHPGFTDMLAVFRKARAIVNRVAMEGECDHSQNICVCFEKRVSVYIDRQIEQLNTLLNGGIRPKRVAIKLFDEEEN